VLLALKHQVPALVGHGGAIVNVSSIAGAVGIYPSRLHRAAKVRVFIECMEVMAGKSRGVGSKVR
jgi:NADP-dependent 3-hydroxy acid dehydrogenase YdfG